MNAHTNCTTRFMTIKTIYIYLYIFSKRFSQDCGIFTIQAVCLARFFSPAKKSMIPFRLNSLNCWEVNLHRRKMIYEQQESRCYPVTTCRNRKEADRGFASFWVGVWPQTFSHNHEFSKKGYVPIEIHFHHIQQYPTAVDFLHTPLEGTNKAKFRKSTAKTNLCSS